MKKVIKKLGSIVALLLVGAVVYAVASAGLRSWLPNYAPSIESKIEIDVKVIEDSIREMSELATLTYNYTDVGEFTEQKMGSLFGAEFALPFGKKSFIIAYDGEMKIGVDMAQVSIALTGNVITLTMPPAHIISHVVKEESVVVFDERNGLFNPISITDYATFMTEQKQVMEDAAVVAGQLTQAGVNAETQIRAFLSCLPDISDEYEIRFKK